MIRTTQRLNEVGPARKLRAEINRLWEETKALRISSGVGYNVKRTRLGTVLDIESAAVSTSVYVQRFKVTAIEEKYLTCRKVDKDDAETSTTDYKVMRPYCTWHDNEDSMITGADTGSLEDMTDSQSRTYDADVDVSGTAKTFSVTQDIFPKYEAGSFIYGTNNVKGGTEEIDDLELKWIDLNVDARHWRLTEQATEVCVDNVVKYALFQRSGVAD